MTIEEYNKVTLGSTAVIIRTGEAGSVISLNRQWGGIKLSAIRAGLGLTKAWYHYTLLGKL